MGIRDTSLSWLIRDTRNVIRGPYTHAEILQLLKKGQLQNKTEIAQANAYWFSIDEKVEFNKFFPELGNMTTTPIEVEPTATLTQSVQSVLDAQLEPTRVGLPSEKKESPLTDANKVEWLSEEYAEEFGEGLEKQDQTKTELIEEHELLSRSSAKADTLPSEMKNSKTERPRVLTNPIKATPPASAAKKPAAATAPLAEKRSFKSLILPLLVVLLLATYVAVEFFPLGATKNKSAAITTASDTSPASAPAGAATPASYLHALRKAFLIGDLDTAKSAVASMEINLRANYALAIAKAMIKKNFLFDVDGALSALETAKALATDPKSIGEVNNLLAVYSYEKDLNVALAQEQVALQSLPNDRVLQFNEAMILAKIGRGQEATQILSAINAGLGDSIDSDSQLLFGWIDELQNDGKNSEAAYRKVLDANPYSSKARLLLAIHKFQRTSAKDAEPEFRRFIDSLPELDPVQIDNFRKINTLDTYGFARGKIRELNGPILNSSVHSSVVAMVSDALLSAIQNKQQEAEKILDNTLSVAPGYADVNKVRAYIRYKEGKFDEVIDLLKDSKDLHTSPGVNMLLGLAYEKSGNNQTALKFYQNFYALAPSRSEAASYIGGIYLKAKHNPEALKYFQAALSKNPLDLHAMQGLSILNEEKAFDNAIFSNLLPF